MSRFGDIKSDIVMPPGTVLRRNEQDTGFESIVPSAGGSGSSTNMIWNTAILINGTATIYTSQITANSIIFLTHQTLGTITRPVGIGVTSRIPRVSFTIMSMDVTDTSTIGWSIIESSINSYYVDYTNGNDANSGLSPAQAWKTIAKVNASSFNPGDHILFKCGETWREKLTPPSHGTAKSPITFRSYDSGAKPKLLGSTDLKLVAWTNDAGNIYYATGLTAGIGILVFDNEASVGVRRTAKANCVAQGEWYYDAGADRLYLYSATSPEIFYSVIEAGTDGDVILVNHKDYITIENFDVRYGGTNGIAVNAWGYTQTDVIVQHNNISYCGGGGSAAFNGNGIHVYNGNGTLSNVTVRYNKVNNIYDSGIAFPQDGATSTFNNIWCYYNLISNCEHGIEIGGIDDTSTINGCYIYNNTIYGSGSGFSHSWRPDPWGDGVIMWGTTADITNMYFENNLFRNCIINVAKGNHDFDGITWNYNLYYPDGATMFMLWPDHSDGLNFANWKTHTGQDANSVITDPKLVSATNYHLLVGSGAIDTGVNVGLATDYDGILVSDPPEIGAYQFV